MTGILETWKAVLVAWYFPMILSGHTAPELSGPYYEEGDCRSAQEWIKRTLSDSEVGTCSLMDFPQPHSVFIRVFYLADIPA